MFIPTRSSFGVLLTLCLLSLNTSWAEETANNDKTEPQKLELADGQLQLSLPGDWKKVKPRSPILEYEFSLPATEADGEPGRLTIMQSGGGVAANINRWKGQFTPPRDAKDAVTIKEESISGLPVHIVDLRGTFHDRRGPFAPATDRAGYRMLAAIIEAKGVGDYFIKLTGPEKTIKQQAKGFQKMIESLSWSGG